MVPDVLTHGKFRYSGPDDVMGAARLVTPFGNGS